MASSQDELRIVLIGRTGNGKSSTGNSLLHSRTAFVASQSAKSITKDCDAKSSQYPDIHGRQKKITVVDTPGFFDTDKTVTNQMVEKKITSQIFNMTSPGVHAFLIVLCIGRFSPEEKNTVDFIKTIFGAGAAKYCIVIFTREDQLEVGQTLEDFVCSSAELKELVNLCGNRKFVINNKLSGQLLEGKTKTLLQMIDEMVNSNNRTYYTNAEYQRIETQRVAEQKRLEKVESDRKKAHEDALVAQARKEEQQKAEKRVQEVREEAARHDRMRNEERAAQCSRRSNDDDLSSLTNAMHQMMSRSSMPQMNPFMDGSSASMRPPSSGMGGGHGGRFTGDFMATRGSANGRPIFEGARGGQYYMSAGGNKSYLPK